MKNMPTTSDDSQPSGSNEGNSNATCQLIKVPKVMLTRLDEKILSSLNVRVSKQISKKSKVNKVQVKSPLNSPDKSALFEGKRPRGRPKKNKDEILQSKPKNRFKVGTKTTMLKSKKALSTKPKKIQSKDGKLLKKTMLQKKSKVAIPPPKKIKKSAINKPVHLIKKIPTMDVKKNVQVEKKQSPPKPKLEIMQAKVQNSSDSSDDDFLYDELIDELENTANKRFNESKPLSDKTTITLKPNVGNKPPTVLKGGIVKKTDLPSDLNFIASPNKPATNKIITGLQTVNQTSLIGKKRSNDVLVNPSPVKKPSPWPVSITPSPRKSLIANSTKAQAKKKVTKVATPSNTVLQSSKTLSKETTKTISSPTTSIKSKPEVIYQSKAITLGMPKPKIGPKKTATVVPLSKSFDQEDNLSDEYLEEESLECEIDQLPKDSNKSESKSTKSKSSLVEVSKNNEANLDLLRILSDFSDETENVYPNDMKNKTEEPDTDSVTIDKNDNFEKTFSADKKASKDQINNTDPPVRTIYDLMNEVSMQYPSWNLHIIPETSAFCIAQVTKGRLGLPTLKKCIELDPVNYKAKVYIHQYHIKRFDGVYDSEESILALIHEIDSIKA